MRTVTVEVTADDIANGVRNKCYHCPVALAIERVTGGRYAVRSDCVEYDPVVVPLPPWAMLWIRQFDTGEPVVPFNFLLEVPDHWVRKGK